ncbi:hypothetical protein DTW90_09130 [Neorhizobium sp. P12A]|jgi:hypothetical protein|uniref:hypothetical protein n=1 Tax=Rhizobium/Agrobacterium group TaxID=227290 RepID=UPI001047838D|nr:MULTISPECIES: hypothetical protein [Rhizobium/Agrobacterium group]KAA0699533.1 hypothetical protein DTW90_09130 [Neorhizobium sp. P12A]TCR91136.1 hypothetical protein EV561_103533 [Rhizobium sp. BK376]
MVEKTRSEKLKRLVTVQRHLERMAEQELADNTRQRTEVSQSIDQTIAAISSTDPMHAAFSHHYTQRFARLSVKDQQLAGMQTVIEMKIMKERTKADRLEDNMKEARELENREADDNAVYDLMDQRMASLTPASSKVHET